MKPDWSIIEAEYLTTNRPVLQIAKDNGVSEGAIRARAKKHGWTRNAAAIKRAEVAKRLDGITKGATTTDIRSAIANAADQDVADMQSGLEVARACIRRLRESIELADDPKDIKVIAEANRISIDTIRRIRGLDAEAAKDDVVVKWEGTE